MSIIPFDIFDRFFFSVFSFSMQILTNLPNFGRRPSRSLFKNLFIVIIKKRWKLTSQSWFYYRHSDMILISCEHEKDMDDIVRRLIQTKGDLNFLTKYLSFWSLARKFNRSWTPHTAGGGMTSYLNLTIPVILINNDDKRNLIWTSMCKGKLKKIRRNFPLPLF